LQKRGHELVAYSDHEGHAAAPPASWPKAKTAWISVLMLALAYLAAFIDRTTMGLLVTPLKAGLGLSDTQIGLLTGAAYGLINAVAALPAGHIADRGSRKRLIVGGMLLFGLATWASGLASGFLALFLARSLVGVGEATLHPAATSTIADLFPPERRSRAYGAYLMAAASAITLVFLVGGPVVRTLTELGPAHIFGFGPFAPWQISFFVAGTPGMAIALMILFLLREPTRRDSLNTGDARASWSDVIAFVAAHRTAFACHLSGSTLLLVSNYALLGWVIPWFERVYGWNTAEAATRFALTAGLACVVGTPLAGELADRFRRAGRTDANYLLALIGGGGFCLLVAAAGVSPSGAIAMGLVGCAGLVLLSVPISFSACVNELAPNRMRARISAGYNLVVAVGATSAGPLLVGLCNDLLFASEAAIGLSLSLVSALTGLAGVTILIAGRKAYVVALRNTEMRDF
jgi:MFS family permease